MNTSPGHEQSNRTTMKNSYLPASLALLVGIGIGWFIKPSNPSVPAGQTVSRETKIERPKPNITTPENRQEPEGSAETSTKSSVRTMVLGGDNQLPKEAREMQDKIATAMENSQRKKDDREIAELVEKLGLDAGQQAKINAFYEKKRAALAGMMSGDSDQMPDFKAMGNGPLEDLMAATLSDEQAKTYAELKATERGKKIESQALKDLAKLNGMIDLRPEQKDAVYQILYDDAGSKVDLAAKSGMGGMMSMMGSDFGVDLDMDSVGLHDSVYLAEDNANTSGDAAGVIEKMRASQREKINAQVKRMEPVLDAKQLEAYREHLEAKGSMFDSMITIPGK